MRISTQAIMSLRPGAQWSLDGDDYSGLDWRDEIQSKPTEQELVAETAVQDELLLKSIYKRRRREKYPPIQDYIDGVVKGDQEQIQAYIDACLAVKAQFPKPD
jgi:predicted P-loop ATPase